MTTVFDEATAAQLSHLDEVGEAEAARTIRTFRAALAWLATHDRVGGEATRRCQRVAVRALLFGELPEKALSKGQTS